jgi:Na+-translocating ferredoxin:NAD+ oxidoreductase RnfE subunit
MKTNAVIIDTVIIIIVLSAQLGVEHFELQVSYRKWALGFAVPCMNVLNCTVGNMKEFSFHIKDCHSFSDGKVEGIGTEILMLVFLLMLRIYCSLNI